VFQVGLDLGGVVEILVVTKVGEGFGVLFELYYDVRKRPERGGEEKCTYVSGKLLRFH